MRVGAQYLGDNRCEFRVWGPFAESMDLVIVSPREETIPMSLNGHGYWRVTAEKVPPGARYFYSINGQVARPDPASHSQPEGMHGPSEVIDHAAFQWGDESWRGIPFHKVIIYEIHTGAFTPEGTFDAIIPRLPELVKFGVTAVELMPVAQFPGERNWGYDGAFPYAVQSSYGGCDALKRLVDACHRHGLAAVLDVVYNHLGPEGNYIPDFGPYLTDKYRTPWGDAINFDDQHSDEVRGFFIENALHWLRNYHFDILRLDAVDYIYNVAAKPFLQELSERVDAYSIEHGKQHYLMAEVDLNDSRFVLPVRAGGYGVHAQWCDDFHHALFSVLTGYAQGYYMDFGTIEQLAKSLRGGYVFTWQYSAYRGRHRGSPSEPVRADQLVVFIQNHDQVGNRLLGERLSLQVPFDALKLAAGAVLLSPYVPLIFMGEEYAEETPFLYFINHGDAALVRAVQEGHRKDLGVYHDEGEYSDPQALRTFLRSKLKWQRRAAGKHKVILNFYHSLIKLRKQVPALASLDKSTIEVSFREIDRLILMRRWHGDSHVFCILNFNSAEVSFVADLPEGTWKKVLDSAERKWRGRGTQLPPQVERGQTLSVAPCTIAVYVRRYDGA